MTILGCSGSGPKSAESAPVPPPVVAETAVCAALRDSLRVEFPVRSGRVIIRDAEAAQPISESECTFTVDSTAPVVLRLTSGRFPVEPGADYAVNFSDRPPLYLKADAQGALHIPVSYPTNYCGLTLARVDPTDLLSGAAWTASVSSVTNPLTGGAGPCGAATRGTDPDPSASPILFLNKTEQGGRVLWASAPVPVSSGKTMLLSGEYRLTNSAFGAKIRMEAILRGPGKSNQTVRDSWMSYFVTPLYGETRRYTQMVVPIPEGYTSATVELSLEGGAQAIEWANLRLREAPHPHFLVSRPLSEEDRTPLRSVEEVRAIWKDREPHEVRVIRRGSLSQLLCDGEPVSLLTYNHYVKAPGTIETGPLLRAGLRLQFVAASVYPRELWVGLDRYDFSDVQSNIETVLQFDPEALVVLNVRLFPKFRDWGERYPDAVWHDLADSRKLAGYKTSLHRPDRIPPGSDDFWYAGYSAEDYRNSAGAALRALASHLHRFDAGKAVVGFMLQGGNDNQWQRPSTHSFEGVDGSPGAVRDFRRYLRERYANDEAALRRAWDDPTVTFDTAALATAAERNPPGWFLDPAKGADRRVMDAIAYEDEGLARTLNGFGRTLKDAMGRSVVVFTYLHDMMEFGGRSSHDILLRGDAVDGVVGIPSYGTLRSAGAPGQITGALRSYGLSGKLHLTEQDIRTHTTWISQDAFTQLRVTMGGAMDEREFVNLSRRDAAMNLARGDGEWFLVMPDFLFNTEGYRAAVAELSRAFQESARHPMPEDAAQIAVYSDQRIAQAVPARIARALASLSTGVYVQQALNRSGVSWDPYFLSDLDHPARPSYRVHVFLNAPTMSKAQVEWIRANLQKDGNVLVFCNAAGRVSDAGPFESVIRTLTGMTVRRETDVAGGYRTVPIPGSDPMARELVDNGVTLWGQPLFVVDDPEAVVFGRIAGTDRAGWAIRRFPDWTSVYVAEAANFTPELFRAFAKEAGLEPVGPNGDVTMAGNGFVMIHALSDGTKSLHFDRSRSLFDLETGAPVPACREMRLPMRAGETRWFRERTSGLAPSYLSLEEKQ